MPPGLSREPARPRQPLTRPPAGAREPGPQHSRSSCVPTPRRLSQQLQERLRARPAHAPTAQRRRVLTNSRFTPGEQQRGSARGGHERRAGGATLLYVAGSASHSKLTPRSFTAVSLHPSHSISLSSLQAQTTYVILRPSLRIWVQPCSQPQQTYFSGSFRIFFCSKVFIERFSVSNDLIIGQNLAKSQEVGE